MSCVSLCTESPLVREKHEDKETRERAFETTPSVTSKVQQNHKLSSDSGFDSFGNGDIYFNLAQESIKNKR